MLDSVVIAEGLVVLSLVAEDVGIAHEQPNAVGAFIDHLEVPLGPKCYLLLIISQPAVTER